MKGRLISANAREWGSGRGTAEAIGGVTPAVCRQRTWLAERYCETGEIGDGGGVLTSAAPSLSILSFILNVESGRT